MAKRFPSQVPCLTVLFIHSCNTVPDDPCDKVDTLDADLHLGLAL